VYSEESYGGDIELGEFHDAPRALDNEQAFMQI